MNFKTLIIPLLLLSVCTLGQKKDKPVVKTGEWVSIFNGKNLDGWIPKVAGDSVGVNTLDVFRVEDSLLKVSYDKYNKLNSRFGHLFYQVPLSKYKLRVEYRFVGKVLSDAPKFCYLNSGVMIHAQSPMSMGISQNYPVSLEVQLLGSSDSLQQHTANLCTPGTTIYCKDNYTEQHIIPSTSKYYYGDSWATVEIIVDGAKHISHVMENDTVLTVSKPQIGGSLLPDNYPIPVGTIINKGYIALQAEGQPIDFKKIELMKLDR